MTLQCTKDGQFIIVIAKDATLPHIDLETVSFLGAGAECHPAGATSAFAIYQFPVTSCGTIMRVRFDKKNVHIFFSFLHFYVHDFTLEQ